MYRYKQLLINAIDWLQVEYMRGQVLFNIDDKRGL